MLNENMQRGMALKGLSNIIKNVMTFDQERLIPLIITAFFIFNKTPR